MQWPDLDLSAWLQTAQEFALPRVIQSSLQIVAAIVLMIVVRWVLSRIEARWVAKTATQVDDIAARMVRRCVLVSIVFWALWRLAHIWELPRMASFTVGVWIVAFAFPISRFVGDLLKVVERRFVARTESKWDDTALPLVNRAAQILIIAAATLSALDYVGVDITPLMGIAGVAGLGLSFAAKDTLSNLIAGILLVLDRPFEIGDRIEVWSAPSNSATWGDVTEIGLRATKIRTTDNITIVIPNNELMQRDIINYTATGDTIRLRIPIGIAYEADVTKAKELILRVAGETVGVQSAPEPVVIIRRFGDSSVNLELRVWLDNARERRSVEDMITDRVMTVFGENGIEIPYPKRELHIRTAPEPLRQTLQQGDDHDD